MTYQWVELDIPMGGACIPMGGVCHTNGWSLSYQWVEFVIPMGGVCHTNGWSHKDGELHCHEITPPPHSYLSSPAPNDYIPFNISLTFSPNGPTRLTVPVTIVDNMVSKDTQTFVVVVTSTDPAVVVNPPQILVTIPNNYSVTIGFDKPSYSVREQDGVVTLCTKLTNGILGRQVVVTMTTLSGTASGKLLV